jgi:hypothetical protein
VIWWTLARTAEWLACETDATVLVIVKEAVVSARELDSISFQAVAWSLSAPPIDSSRAVETAVRIWPVIGRPHPYSPGEQLLAARLANDPLLSRLFGFDLWVETRFENRYLADLLWSDGKVVIEIDGYEHHSSRHSFTHDRQRDYELLVTSLQNEIGKLRLRK